MLSTRNSVSVAGPTTDVESCTVNYITTYCFVYTVGGADYRVTTMGLVISHSGLICFFGSAALVERWSFSSRAFIFTASCQAAR